MGIYRYKKDGRKFIRINLGIGDVAVGVTEENSKIQAIGFAVLDVPIGIGDDVEVGATGNNPMTYISFERLESLEVVERAIAKIRKNLEAQCVKPLEYFDD